jgi:hypothetical protein
MNTQKSEIELFNNSRAFSFIPVYTRFCHCQSDSDKNPCLLLQYGINHGRKKFKWQAAVHVCPQQGIPNKGEDLISTCHLLVQANVAYTFFFHLF